MDDPLVGDDVAYVSEAGSRCNGLQGTLLEPSTDGALVTVAWWGADVERDVPAELLMNRRSTREGDPPPGHPHAQV